jgi:serine/threonine-protein kinase
VAAGASTADAAGLPVELTVHVRPYAQRALLDGAEVASGAQVVRVSIAPGRLHTLQLEHPCCKVFTRVLGAEEAAGLVELRVPLEPRPARLRVEGDPSTRILLDGRDLGSAGDSQRTPLSIPVPPGGESPYEAVVRLELASQGRPPRTVAIKLRAGGELTVAAPTAEATP